MLLRLNDLKRIKTGEITLAFRCWKRPTVKSGGNLHTPIGLLAIESVDEISIEKITKKDALKAGFSDKQELLNQLQSRQGKVCRVQLRYEGQDPRLALRRQDDLTDAELEELAVKLSHMDARSNLGPWTIKSLQLIADHPHVVAQQLADEMHIEKSKFKTNIRKLKNLGLTMSHGVGYEISPRGQRVLDYMIRKT